MVIIVPVVASVLDDVFPSFSVSWLESRPLMPAYFHAGFSGPVFPLFAFPELILFGPCLLYRFFRIAWLLVVHFGTPLALTVVQDVCIPLFASDLVDVVSHERHVPLPLALEAPRITLSC